jgi:hypothetical protein
MGIKDKQDFTIPLLRAAGEAIQKKKYSSLIFINGLFVFCFKAFFV